MYDTGGTHSVCRPAAVCHDLDARLSWLGAAIADAEGGALARREAEESAALAMRDPLTTAEAYGWFGLLLGLFPPAAIFGRMFGFGLEDSKGLLWVFMFAAALAVCCAVGRLAARFAARSMVEPRRYHPAQLLLLAALLGAFWGSVTGGAGGAVFFGVGALGGIFFGAPIGAAAFPVFALAHRRLSRGGMIEERMVWPLAFGVPAVVAAAILGA